jgi:HSP20 family protein
MFPKLKDRESARQEKRIIQPAVDIYETEKGVIVEAELPGVNKDSLTVDALNDQLTITGTRKKAQAEGYTALYQECDSEVEYRRSFQLNSEIDQQNIEADFKAGLLRLKLTKSQETQPRKITINS